MRQEHMCLMLKSCENNLGREVDNTGYLQESSNTLKGLGLPHHSYNQQHILNLLNS